jgi:hypothetical protein
VPSGLATGVPWSGGHRGGGLNGAYHILSVLAVRECGHCWKGSRHSGKWQGGGRSSDGSNPNPNPNKCSGVEGVLQRVCRAFPGLPVVGVGAGALQAARQMLRGPPQRTWGASGSASVGAGGKGAHQRAPQALQCTAGGVPGQWSARAGGGGGGAAEGKTGACKTGDWVMGQAMHGKK